MEIFQAEQDEAAAFQGAVAQERTGTLHGQQSAEEAFDGVVGAAVETGEGQACEAGDTHLVRALVEPPSAHGAVAPSRQAGRQTAQDAGQSSSGRHRAMASGS